jgi:hypothetical protein
MKKHFLLLALASALAVAGCGNGDTDTPDGGNNNHPDGGEGGGKPDGGEPDGGKPPPEAHHKLTTRPLLGGMSAKNLILDPFVTPDESLEHFIGLTFQGQTPSEYKLSRQTFSDAPMGVAVPLIALPRAGGTVAKFEVLSPFPGTAAATASIWVAATDSTGKSVAFSEAAKDLVAAVLPEDDASKSFPLAAKDKPVKLGAQSWQKLEADIAVPQGGFFTLASKSTTWRYLLQAPQVVEGSADANRAPPWVRRDPQEAAAIAAYVRIARTKRPHR